MSETVDNKGLEPEAAPEPSEAPETAPEEAKPPEDDSRLQRRIAQMRAQLGSAARERDEMAARVAALEQRMREPQQQPTDQQQLEAYINSEVEKRTTERQSQTSIKAFHDAGRAAYPDWAQRCNELQGMGADAQIAALLVEMPDGHRVAAALHDDPDELMQIASMRGERQRAIALGQYAAKLQAQPTRNISKVPPPPRPITGRANVAFNPYMETDTSKLVDYFQREALEKRRTG